MFKSILEEGAQACEDQCRGMGVSYEEDGVSFVEGRIGGGGIELKDNILCSFWGETIVEVESSIGMVL